MAGKTVTRAQLAEAVYQGGRPVAQQSADLVDAILDEISRSLLKDVGQDLLLRDLRRA